ncbi:MAG: peptidase and matrixin and adamalysin [Actinotalea sp.]|nr:peptidase and matrixin and adamalysin [Actinotalea sp.]
MREWLPDETLHVPSADLGWTTTPVVWDPPPRPEASTSAASAAPSAARQGSVLPWAGLVLAVLLSLPAIQWLGRGEAPGTGPDGRGFVAVSTDGHPLPLEDGRGWPRAGFEEAGVPLGVPPAVVPASTAYVFQDIQTTAWRAEGAEGAGGGVPVAWSPCRPIHVVVDPRGAPDGFSQEVTASLAAASAASGLVFVEDGITDEPVSGTRPAYQPDRYGDRWAPVLIQWTDAVGVPALTSGTVGLATMHSVTDRRTGVTHLISGVVHLDTELLVDGPRTPPTAWVPVLRHEIGHVLGLDHVDDPAQLMHATSMRAQTFQTGDLAGLARLGAGRCAPGL